MPIIPKKQAPGGAKSNGQQHDYRKVFERFGVGFGEPNGSGEAVAEACPWCCEERFYLNITTGQYHCKHCDAGGNIYTYLTWQHQQYLDITTDDHYRALKEKRGIALQTLKRHNLAYDPEDRRWLVPFYNKQGSVINVQSYYPCKTSKPNKYNLPEMPSALYGLEHMTNDPKKPVFLCEGPWDAMAVEYQLGKKRYGYDTVATPGTFKADWCEYFKGRKVRALYDNDPAGTEHRERVRKLLEDVAADLRLLVWPPEYRKGYDLNDLVRDYPEMSIPGFVEENSVKVVREPKLVFQHGRRATDAERPVDWIWPNHLHCGTYVSFSGYQGTFKSTIAQELAARYTTGSPMPLEEIASMPAGHVLYIYAEDDRDRVENAFEKYGGDFAKFTSMPAVARDGDPLNVLEHLPEMEEVIRQYGIRLVLIDGQNSVVGAPNISTDMLARTNVTNKLHQFAQRLNICMMGIRNEDKDGRALGPQSFGDIGRCVWRAVETDPKGDPPYCVLEFVKVSGVARKKYPAIPYSVRDNNGHPVILWGKARPRPAEVFKAKAAANLRRGKG